MNYPQIKPTLNLDFSNTKTLDPRINFRRGTPGAYYDGKTYAKAEENLLSYSEDFSQWSNVRSDITASQSAPDGSSDAYKIAQASGETSACVSSITANMINGKNYVYSIYAKAGTNRNYLTVRIYDYSISDHYQYFLFDLGNGQTLDNGIKRSDYYGGVHEIEGVGNDWYRCIVSFPVVNDSANGFLISNYILDTPSSSTTSVADDGGFIHIWGAQLEQRDSLTSYTPTNGTPITKYQPQLMFASPDQPRFDHDVLTGESKGLLIEEQRTNLIEYSEDISGAGWSSDANFETNVVVSPDGKVSGDRIYQTDAINYQSRNDNINIVSGVDYVYSVYAKNDNLGYLRINVAGGSGIRYNLINATLTIDGSTGSVVSAFSGDIEFVGNGWYRCIYKFTSSFTGLTSVRNVVIYTNSEVQGDGKSGVYIWGAQLEEGSFPTSYIKTSGASATRSADNASITGENFSSWYRQDEGSIYAKIISAKSVGGMVGQCVLSIGDGGSENILRLRRSITTRTVGFFKRVNDTNTAIANSDQSLTDNTEGKLIGAYDLDNSYVALDGSSVFSASGASPLNLNKAIIGSSPFVNGDYLNGHIKKLSYYPQRLTNEQLQQLTK